MKILLACAGAFLIGFLGYHIYTGNIQQIISPLQPVLVYIQSAWATIPENLRGTILVGVPATILTGFFAWTKMRAMQKLQETQLKAKQQITQISGEAKEYKSQLDVLTSDKYGKASVDKIAGLATDLKTAQDTLKIKQDEISRLFQNQINLEKERNYYSDKVKALQAHIDVLEGRIKPPTP